MTKKRNEPQYGPHPAGEGAAIWFHAVLAVVFVAEFVLGLYTLPHSRSIGIALLALSPVGVWFHGVGAVRHFQEWAAELDEPEPVYGFRHPRAEEEPFEDDPGEVGC